MKKLNIFFVETHLLSPIILLWGLMNRATTERLSFFSLYIIRIFLMILQYYLNWINFLHKFSLSDKTKTRILYFIQVLTTKKRIATGILLFWVVFFYFSIFAHFRREKCIIFSSEANFIFTFHRDLTNGRKWKSSFCPIHAFSKIFINLFFWEKYYVYNAWHFRQQSPNF